MKVTIEFMNVIGSGETYEEAHAVLCVAASRQVAFLKSRRQLHARWQKIIIPLERQGWNAVEREMLRRQDDRYLDYPNTSSDIDDIDYLGETTLSKLRTGTLTFED